MQKYIIIQLHFKRNRKKTVTCLNSLVQSIRANLKPRSFPSFNELSTSFMPTPLPAADFFTASPAICLKIIEARGKLQNIEKSADKVYLKYRCCIQFFM